MSFNTISESLKKLNKVVYRTFLGNEFDDLSMVSRKNLYNKKTHRIPSFSRELGYLFYDKDLNIFFNEHNAGYLFQICPLTGGNERLAEQLDSILREKLTENNTFHLIKVVHNKVGERIDSCVSQFQGSGIDGIETLTRHLEPYWKKAALDKFHTRDGVYATLLDCEIYLVIDMPVDVDVDDSSGLQNVSAELGLIRRGVESAFTSSQIGFKRCDVTDLLRLVSFYTDPSISNIYNKQHSYDEEKVIRDQVSNGHFGCEIETDGLYLDGLNGDLTNTTTAVTVLTMAEPPVEFSLNMNSDLVNNIFEKHATITCNHIVSVIYKSENQAKAQFIANRKTSSLNKKANSKYAMNVTGTIERAKQWKKFRDDLNLKKTKSIKMLYNLVLFSKPENQGRDVQNAKLTFAYSGIQLSVCKWMQAPYFLVSMPFMFSGYLEKDFALPNMMEPISSWNAVQMMPLISDWSGNPSGMILPSIRNQISQIDNYSGAFGSGLGIVITGMTRGGKSFYANTMVMNTLSQGGDVFIIDVGGSYKKLTQLLGGTYIEYSNLAMNPFTNVESIETDITNIIDLFSMLTLPETGANENDRSTLRKAILNAYSLKKKETLIDDVKNELRNLYTENPVTYSKGTILAESLEPYCTTSEKGNIFNKPSKLDPNARLLVIDLEDLREKKDTLLPVLVSLFSQLQRRIYKTGRDMKKMFIMDEVMNILGDNPPAAKFVVSGYRMGSRFNCSYVIIAQGVADFYRLDDTKVAYENSALKLVFKQDPTSLTNFQKEHDVFTASEYSVLQQFPFPKEVGYSHVLVKGSTFSSFNRLFVDPFTLVAMSSTGEDFQAVENYVKSGMTYIQSIDRVAKEHYRGMYE